MIFNQEGFKRLGDNIFVYNNFMTEAECDAIVEYLELLDESDWWRPHPEPRFKVKDEKAIDSLNDIRKRVQSILSDGYGVGKNTNPHKLLKGTSRYKHEDNHEFLPAREALLQYVDGSEFDYADDIDLGMYVFFNNFDGGDFNYENQGIVYHPLKGDLILHGAEEDCAHSTSEILSEKYYAWPNHIYHSVKIPKGYTKDGNKLTNSLEK